MEAKSKHYFYERDIIQANKYRTYLRVVIVADIAIGNTKRTCACDKYINRIRIRSKIRNIDWPIQIKPINVDWRLWDIVIKIHTLSSKLVI